MPNKSIHLDLCHLWFFKVVSCQKNKKLQVSNAMAVLDFFFFAFLCGFAPLRCPTAHFDRAHSGKA
jgi:hypothetical protein